MGRSCELCWQNLGKCAGGPSAGIAPPTDGRLRHTVGAGSADNESIRALSLPCAHQLARAFALYFELINLAETNHRKRRRLSSQLDPAAEPQRGSLQIGRA